MDQSRHSETVRRAALPQILFIPDLAVALQESEAAARRAVLQGDCGPYFKIGERLAVLRESFLQALAQRESASLANRPRLLEGGEDQ